MCILVQYPFNHCISIRSIKYLRILTTSVIQVPLARGEQPPLRQLHAVSVKPTKLIKVFDQFHSLFDLSRPFKTIRPHMIGFSTFVSVLNQMITASDGAGRFCAIITRRLDGMKTTCIAPLRGHPVVCYRIVRING